MRIALLGAVLSCAGCLSIPTATAAKVSYSTAPADWSESVACLNKPKMAGIAKEVLNGKRRTVVIAAGANPISDAAWAEYSPSFGNRKNSDRHTLFSRSCFSRSPSKSPDCVGAACSDIIELDGYTWVGLSKIDAADCLPSAANCDGASAKPGGLLVVVTEKCHQLVFEGEVWMLRGPHGEKAIMHATEDGKPTTDVQLPPGWTLAREVLEAPLTVNPFGGPGQCFYNILRDAKLQSYHQLAYAGPSYP